MSQTFITATPRGSMHPLAFQGISVAECHAQIVDIVRSRLGESYVLLFAEPVFDADREMVDWYSPVRGTPHPFASLPDDQKEMIRTLLGRMGAELRTAAEKLIASGEQHRIMSGSILKLALSYPDESCLYVVGDQPVMTCWGFGPATAGAQPQDISRLTGTPPATPPSAPQPPVDIPEPAQKAASGFSLFWLLPVILLVLLAGLLLVGFGGQPPILPGLHIEAPALFPAPPPAPDTTVNEAALRAEIDALKGKLAERAALCPKKQSPQTPPNELLVPPVPDQKQDLAFMRGVWRCDTGLRNANSGTPISIEYTFDGVGGGSITITGDKGICTAPVRAARDATGGLVIESEQEISCPNGNPYSGQRVECTSQGSETICQGRNLSPGARTWQANFHRKK